MIPRLITGIHVNCIGAAPAALRSHVTGLHKDPAERRAASQQILSGGARFLDRSAFWISGLLAILLLEF
ncbi:hypothetical protein VTN96DRAFT_8060 [Rasamsonia emersonii]